jgi:hypothetical protein
MGSFCRYSHFGDEQVDRVPLADPLLLFVGAHRGLTGRSHRLSQLHIGQLGDVHLAVQDVPHRVQVVAVLHQLVAQGEPDLVGEVILLLGGRLRHHDH